MRPGWIWPPLLLSLVVSAMPAFAKEVKVDDPSIGLALERQLLMDPAVPFDPIDVQVDDGVVTLSGTVDNLLASRRAARIARIVKGVRAVVNRLDVSPTEPVSDDALRERVERALLMDPATDSYEIGLGAEGGRVSLVGKVQSQQERWLAEEVAAGVNGVVAVDNRLQVKEPVARPDFEIAPEIERILANDVRVDDGMIEVHVEGGVASLRGIVGSAAEKRIAQRVAWVPGVTAVKADGLKVERWARDADLRRGKYAPKSDEEIRSAVEEAMLLDPRVNSFQIDAKVVDGRLALRGVVDNLKAKRTAERDAYNTVGVKQVDNLIKVRPVLAAPNPLAKRVEQALGADPFLAGYDLDATPRGAKVYLTGTVDTYFQKAHADDLVARVNGVAVVENNLRVDDDHLPLLFTPYIDDWYIRGFGWYDYQPSYTIRSDDQIEAEVRDQLFWSPFVDSKDVEIEVDRGVVTLSGQVASRGAKQAAAENAIEGGAVWVVNRIEVDRK